MRHILHILNDDQIRTAMQICKVTGLPVGGLSFEDYAAILEERTTLPERPETDDSAVVFRGIKAAAEYIGCGTRTLERYLDTVPHYKVGSCRFFRKKEIDKWIKEQEGGKR